MFENPARVCRDTVESLLENVGRNIEKCGEGVGFDLSWLVKKWLQIADLGRMGAYIFRYEIFTVKTVSYTRGE